MTRIIKNILLFSFLTVFLWRCKDKYDSPYKSPGTGYLVANLGSGTGTSVQQLAETALAVAGRSIPIVQHANPDRPRGADIDRLVADVSQARSHLGWEPTVSLADGLAMTVKSLGEHP